MAQSSSRESPLSPKEDQGFPRALINPHLVSAPALGLGTAGSAGEADCKRTLVFLAPTSKGCNVENPFLLTFCQLLGPTTCNLLTCRFSSWSVLLKSQLGAETPRARAQLWAPCRAKGASL